MNDTLVCVLALVAMFIFFLVTAQVTGKSFIRFPFTTERKLNPGWFWFGQAFYLVFLLITVLLGGNYLYQSGWFARLVHI